MATSNVKLTADTSQAQSAMGALKTSWINAAAGMAVVEKAFNLVAGAAASVNEAIRDQGKFFSAVKDDAGLAAVQIGMSITDGMIKPMAMAKAQNILMRGDLKLTQDQFGAVAKAAVEMGRATGEDAGAVLDRLTKSIAKGSTEAFEEFGIRVESTGTKTERSSRMIEQLTARYGDLTIAVGDAAEAQEKAANQSELQMLQIARQTDSLSQTLTKFKDFYKNEFLAGGIDALLGSTFARSNQQIALMNRMYSDLTDRAIDYFGVWNNAQSSELAASKKLNDSELERQRNRLAQIESEMKIKAELNAISEKMGAGSDQRDRLEAERAREINELEMERQAIIAMLPIHEGRRNEQIREYGELRNKEIADRRVQLAHAKKQLEDTLKIEQLQKLTGREVMTQAQLYDEIARWRGEVAKLEPQVAKDLKEQSTQAALIEASYKRIASFAQGIAKTIGAGAVWKENDEERKKRLEREKEEAERRVTLGARAYEQGMKATADYLKSQDEAVAKSLDDQLAAFGKYQDDMAALKKRKADEALTAEQLGFAAEFNRKREQAIRVDEARAEIIEANARRETEARKKAMDEDIANRKEYVAKTKELVEGLSQVTLSALFAEKKAREGLSKTEYLMKQLAAYMKGEALKYAAKSIGYAAEGVAATFWNPPAAAAAFKASALSAAAAAAFGGGAAAAGALAGKSSPTSSSTSSGAGARAPDREAVGGTGTTGPASVNIVIQSRGGLLMGTMDDLAREINAGLQQAYRRGVIRG